MSAQGRQCANPDLRLSGHWNEERRETLFGGSYSITAHSKSVKQTAPIIAPAKEC